MKGHCNGWMCVASTRCGGCECACELCCDAMFNSSAEPAAAPAVEPVAEPPRQQFKRFDRITFAGARGKRAGVFIAYTADGRGAYVLLDARHTVALTDPSLIEPE